MPCQYIASVCRGKTQFWALTCSVFPYLPSVFFGGTNTICMVCLEKEDHQKLRGALLALADNDTQGLPCPTNLDKPIDFPCADSVIVRFHLQATDRLLNYNSSITTDAAVAMRDRKNPQRLMQQAHAGLSQLSHLPSQESGDNDDWYCGIEELSDTEDYGHSRKVLSRHYNDVTEAIHNSHAKVEFEKELKEILNNITVRARAQAIIPFSSNKGLRLSMIPPSSKKRKTHGTKHY
jgi:hypothetical protein